MVVLAVEGKTGFGSLIEEVTPEGEERVENWQTYAAGSFGSKE